MQLQNSKIFESEQPILNDEDTLWSFYSNKLTQQIARCSNNSKPDFLIIAPARTGTTWLAENLRRHPGIYIPPEKEVHYFDIHWRRHDINWYLDRVSDTSAQFSGEATPTYALLPSYAIELIRLLNPRLKLIFIMRDPAARAWSHMKHNFINREANFALSPISDQLEDLDIKTQCENFLHDYPLSAGDYEGALTRWSRYFPQSQFHLTFFEDIYTDPESFLRNVLRFIGIGEPVVLSSFPIRQKINRGINGEPSETATQLLRCLYTPRVRSLARFLRASFKLAIPWNDDDSSCENLIWLMDTTPNWRIYLFNGCFWAIEKASWKGKLESAFLLDQYKEAGQTKVKRSAFFGDLLRELNKGSVSTDVAGIEQPLGQEDRRLTYILKDLVRYYDLSLRSSIVRNHQGVDISQANRAEPQLLEEGYRGFNFIAFDYKVWAVDQRVGPTDLRDAAARERLGAEGRLVAATTLDGARLAVDSLVLEERTVVLSSALNERMQTLSRDLEHKLSGVALSAQESVCEEEITRLAEALATLADKVRTLTDDANCRWLDRVEGNGAEPHLMEESYQHFNFVAYDHKVWAVDQRAGPTDLRDAAARKRLGAEGRLVAAATLAEARLAVDVRLIEERVRAMEAGLDEFNAHMSDVKWSKQLAQDTGRELDGLRSRVSEFESTLVQNCEECRQSVNQTKSSLEEQIEDLRQNALVRVGYYVSKKIKKIRGTQS